MSWRYVLDSEKLSCVSECVTYARRLGYEFFAFNGEIWFVEKLNHHKTRLTVNDLSN